MGGDFFRKVASRLDESLTFQVAKTEHCFASRQEATFFEKMRFDVTGAHFGNSWPDRPDLAEMASSTAARTSPTSRAGDWDDGR